MPTPIEEMTAAVQNPGADPTPAVADPATAAPSPEGAEPSAAAPDSAAKPDIIGKALEGEAPAGDEPAPELDSQGRMRDPVTKKFVAAEPKAGDKPAAPAAKPAEAPKAPEAPKIVDPVNDPIPENVKAGTRERIVALVDTVKAKDSEVAAARDDFELVMAPIREAGANPDQFRESMNLVKLINSPLAADQHQALQYLQSAAAAMAQKLGVVPAGVDPLAEYPDLQAAVQKDGSFRRLAEDAAAGRRLAAATQRQNTEQQQRSQQTAEQNRAAQAGQAAVRSVEQTLEATDPNYKAKVSALRANTAFMSELRALPPTQWASKFAEGYRTIQIAPPAAKAPAAPSAPQPLRAKQPAGQAARIPTSSLEAVSAAINAVGA